MSAKDRLTKYASRMSTVWLGAAALLAGACGSIASTSQVHPDSHQRTSSLLGCIQQWNHATLGEGRSDASLDAAAHTQAALMFAFPNGACGLAFAHRITATGSHRKPLITFDSGDYPLEWSPLGFVSAAERAKLNTDASRRSNVTVRGDGSIVAQPYATIRIVPNVFETPSCTHTVVVPVGPMGAQYEIVKTTASCVMVRTLLWAWTYGQASKTQASSDIIRADGWRCVGHEAIPGFTPVTYENVTCARGVGTMEARNLLRQRYE